MNYYSRNSGFIYIFENQQACKIKVGITFDDIGGRLKDLNRKWLDYKVTCQVCGVSLQNRNGFISFHVQSGIKCPGGGELPLENDVSIAIEHLKSLKNLHQYLTGAAKGSNTRRMKTLEKRIMFYKNYKPRVGSWEYSCSYYTKKFDQVESLTHDILKRNLDRNEQIGEIFDCSMKKADEAIELALSKLGMLDSAEKLY